MSDLKSLIDKYVSIEPNENNKTQILELQKQGNEEKLKELLCSRITFGTAGLRAKMEAGFNRLNEATVLQASQGLAIYAEKTAKNLNIQRSIVIGHDHRHNSSNFAKITAIPFLQKKFKVFFIESGEENDSGYAATPLVPFAVDKYGADVGVMITASHNPAADNGYKVYWGNGCQIIPPHDKGIADCILENLDPWSGAWSIYGDFENNCKTNVNLTFVKHEVVAAFYEKVKKSLILAPDFEKYDFKKLKLMYTPVHGVGYEFVEPIFSQIFSLNSDNYHVVKQQVVPDPDFSTVSFPNPEEKGALDLAIASANEQNIDLIIANDPDADRFSAAVREDGKFRQLTGNELGFLFAWYILELKIAANEDISKTYLLNSTVSSQMIKSLAEKLGCIYCDTLTGFKWIGNKAIDLEKEGFDVAFGYEEAIGFMFKNVHDKDGLAATTVFLQLYYEYTIKQGMSLVTKLEEGFKKFGYFKEFNGYYKFQDLTITGKIFKKIRESYPKGTHPAKISTITVTYWRDLTVGYESSAPDLIPLLPTDKSSHMITGEFKLDEHTNVRFTARGSGTEPKLKVYIEGKGDTEEKAIGAAKDVWGVLRNEWFKPELYGLEEVHP